jgi:hypothetical protein
MTDIFTTLRRLFGISSADEFIAQRPAENLAMLRQRLSALEATLMAVPQPGAGTAEAAIHAEVSQVLGTARDALDENPASVPWEAVLRAEILLARLTSADDLPAELARRLERLKALDAPAHDALAAQWTKLEQAATQQGNTLDLPKARAVLAKALEIGQWREAQRYLIRKLGVLYAGRLVSTFVVAIVLGLMLVLWEVYTPRWPLTEARFSGFAIALVAGILGASFSALTRQRDIAGLNNLEEVRTAIGYPMILLRLGVGTGAAAILYFLFESGLIDGMLFPDLNTIGFGPVTLAQAAGEAGQTVTLPLEAARNSLSGADSAARSAAAALERLADAVADDAAAAQTLSAAQLQIGTVSDRLGGVREALAGVQGVELGRFVPNMDLSKLVVWSFLAGFSEMLVPNILGRVEASQMERGG